VCGGGGVGEGGEGGGGRRERERDRMVSKRADGGWSTTEFARFSTTFQPNFGQHNKVWALSDQLQFDQCEGDAPPPRSYHSMAAVGADLFVFGGCGTFDHFDHFDHF
jgi:hypothetical protein